MATDVHRHLTGAIPETASGIDSPPKAVRVRDLVKKFGDREVISP